MTINKAQHKTLSRTERDLGIQSFHINSFMYYAALSCVTFKQNLFVLISERKSMNL